MSQNPLSASELWNLVADGYADIYHTFKPGGSIAITSWAPVDQSPAMQTMFGALRAIKPDLPQPQRSVTTLGNPERFMQEMEEARFRNVEIHSITKPFPTGSTEEFWDNMVKGSAPIQMMLHLSPRPWATSPARAA